MKTFKELVETITSPEKYSGEEPYHIKMSVSLLTRLAEFFNENQVSDQELHEMIETIEHLSAGSKVLGMSDYLFITGESDEEDEEFDPDDYESSTSYDEDY